MGIIRICHSPCIFNRCNCTCFGNHSWIIKQKWTNQCTCYLEPRCVYQSQNHSSPLLLIQATTSRFSTNMQLLYFLLDLPLILVPRLPMQIGSNLSYTLASQHSSQSPCPNQVTTCMDFPTPLTTPSISHSCTSTCHHIAKRSTLNLSLQLSLSPLLVSCYSASFYSS